MPSYVLEHDMYSISLLMPAPPEQHHPAGDDVDEDGGTRGGRGGGIFKEEQMNTVSLSKISKCDFGDYNIFDKKEITKKKKLSGSMTFKETTLYLMELILGLIKGTLVGHLYPLCYSLFTYCTVCVKSK